MSQINFTWNKRPTNFPYAPFKNTTCRYCKAEIFYASDYLYTGIDGSKLCLLRHEGANNLSIRQGNDHAPIPQACGVCGADAFTYTGTHKEPLCQRCNIHAGHGLPLSLTLAEMYLELERERKLQTFIVEANANQI